MSLIDQIETIIESLKDEKDLLRVEMADLGSRLEAAAEALESARVLKTYLERVKAGEIVPADAVDEEPEPEPLPDDVVPQESETHTITFITFDGPWPRDFLANCHEENVAGASLKAIAEKHEVNYQKFCAAMRDYRDSEPFEDICSPAPAPKPPRCKDPDQVRDQSGWTYKEDIHLLEMLGLGWKVGTISDSLERSPDEIKARFAVLVPSKSPEQQGVVLTDLRALQQEESRAA